MVFRDLAVVVLVLLASSALAQPQPQTQPQQQPPPAPSAQPQLPSEQSSDSLTVINQKHYIRVGHVEINQPDGTQIFADHVDFFTDENRALGAGNVLLVQGKNRISAERAEFNTKTGLGTFYNASGIATLQPQRQQPLRPGTIAPPPVVGQENVVYFFGETVEKLGPKKYKITKGGFTTCVQPTPRWDMHADTVLLNVDHYTVLKQAVMTVKGVPMLYLPILYYPTKRGERATGFLLPTYGTSSLRGQSLHNAFFWAIDRSQDATFTHDYYSKTGQGVGSEYRYNFGGGTDGNIRMHLLDQHDATYTTDGGSPQTVGAIRSYEIRGGASQLLPGNLRARGRVDYFSSIATSQTFNTNIYDSARNQRSFGGNIVGAWGTYTMNATLNHSEYFYDTKSSVLSGGWPQIAFNRNERPLFGSQLYVSVSTEYAHMLSDSRSESGDGATRVVTETNQNLNRLDFAPQIRYPFKQWPWLTANSTVSWRDTYYSRILTPVDPTGTISQTISGESFNRRFVILQTQLVGPVFNRIWDTPTNGYAEKFKHSIEPFLTVQKTTDVKNFDRIVRFDGVDSYVGGTQYTYGLTNRFYGKRKLTPGQPAQAREIVNVELRQSYYTNQAAAQYDTRYQTSLVGGGVPSNFSPIALSVRAMPTNDINGTLTMEFDSRYHYLRTVSANGTYSWSQQLQTSVTWSNRKDRFAQPDGIIKAQPVDHYINTSTTVRTKDNRYGTTYSFNFDVLNSTMIQQRITGFYNAQCCGLAFEYQNYHFGANSSVPIASDHRFFLSFTLAGLGNFSPFNGALGGVPR